MRIVFVRHGEPDYEHDCLTPAGREQALAVAERLKEDGIEEICEGKTEQDLPYNWFGGTDLQHAFRCDPDRHYSQADHVICYRKNNIG